ncbi:hypothetical protein V6N11_084156 [Hibiscus sabdariffa]|uniref:Uncharacterized protein n=1 Tax=Hibiscus sabdariffa TaxID=183260 RepID=A0ABR1ZW71_9ROSI
MWKASSFNYTPNIIGFLWLSRWWLKATSIDSAEAITELVVFGEVRESGTAYYKFGFCSEERREKGGVG